MDINDFHRRLAKTSEFPFCVRILALTISSWLFQGILYMDKTERIFKICIDVILFVIFSILLKHINVPLNFILAFFIAHTINWILNGHIYVLFKNLELVNTRKIEFENYLDSLEQKAINESSIICVVLFGSLSRDELDEMSDLDVRIVRRSGVVNGIRSSFFVMRERLESFFKRFPLDIYLLDDYKGFSKLDEDGIVLYNDRDNS